MAERLDVGDHLAVVEHRHGAAQVGQVADAAFGEIRVVHQEHVARPHGLGRKVAHHGVRHRRIGAAGELAAVAVEQADAIVVRLADHRRARGALDGVLDLGLDGIERALDDLQHDRIDRACAARCGAVGQGCLRCGGAGFIASTSAGGALERHDQHAMRIDLEILAGKHDGGGAELLDDGRSVEPEARQQRRAVVDRRVAEGAVEIDRADRLARRRRAVALGELGNARALDQAEAGDAEVDQLDLLLAGVVVAEGALGGRRGRRRSGRRGTRASTAPPGAGTRTSIDWPA